MQNNIIRLFLFIILSAVISLALSSQNIFSQKVLAQTTNTPFTVITYNIGMLNSEIIGPDPDTYIEKLATYISQKKPQIISLQEVVNFTQYKQNGTLQPFNYNTFEQLKSKLRSKGWEMNGTYSERWELSNDQRSSDMRGLFGQLILTRGSSVDTTTVHKFSETDGNGNSQLYSLFETNTTYGGIPITVFSTHPHPGETSCSAAGKIMNKVNEVTGFKLLLGDLNMPPWAQCFETYLANDTMADVCLTSWNNAGDFSLRDASCVNSTNHSFFPPPNQDALIDHIIYSTNTVSGVTFNTESVRVDTSNVNSDHFPLIASLKLNSPVTTPRTETVSPTNTPSPSPANLPLDPPVIPIPNPMDPDSINPICSADGWSATYKWNKPDDTRVNGYFLRSNFKDLSTSNNSPWYVNDGTDIFAVLGDITEIQLPIIPMRTYQDWSLQSIITEESWTHTANSAATTSLSYLYICQPEYTTPTGSCLDEEGALTEECTFENWIAEYKLQYGYNPNAAATPRTNPRPDLIVDGIINLEDFEILRQKKYTVPPTATPTLTPTLLPTATLIPTSIPTATPINNPTPTLIAQITPVSPPLNSMDSIFIAHTIPLQMVSGQRYDVSIYALNNGHNPWKRIEDRWGIPSYELKLGSPEAYSSDAVLFGDTRILILDERVIQTNEYRVFHTTLVAPDPGTYTIRYQLLYESFAWFGDVLTIPVTVTQN